MLVHLHRNYECMVTHKLVRKEHILISVSLHACNLWLFTLDRSPGLSSVVGIPLATVFFLSFFWTHQSWDWWKVQFMPLIGRSSSGWDLKCYVTMVFTYWKSDYRVIRHCCYLSGWQIGWPKVIYYNIALYNIRLLHFLLKRELGHTVNSSIQTLSFLIFKLCKHSSTLSSPTHKKE